MRRLVLVLVALLVVARVAPRHEVVDQGHGLAEDRDLSRERHIVVAVARAEVVLGVRVEFGLAVPHAKQGRGEQPARVRDRDDHGQDLRGGRVLEPELLREAFERRGVRLGRVARVLAAAEGQELEGRALADAAEQRRDAHVALRHALELLVESERDAVCLEVGGRHRKVGHRAEVVVAGGDGALEPRDVRAEGLREIFELRLAGVFAVGHDKFG
mmetsp:Transcript_14583/g.50351  ORF Transcript_14583/g.50351 Transcript_14583/m.50351 type:complete len:215 (+) Transcript_14583:1166-1810(+)